jgi:hypothetical protein
MLVKSPVTVMPVLVGPVAGETVTVRSVALPGSTEFGLADPEPDKDPLPAQVFVIELLRGIGPLLTLKSALLLSVSVQPLLFLIAATRFVVPPVGEVSEQLAAPYPTKSTIPFAKKAGQVPLKTVVLLTSATFPPVEPTAIDPVASGVGRRTEVVTFAPAASWIR